MVDSRLPSRWLHDPMVDVVSDYAWRMYTYSLMLANEQQSDGYIAPTQLRFLHPQGFSMAAITELLDAALWEPEGAGYRVQRWAETQTTAAALAQPEEQSGASGPEGCRHTGHGDRFGARSCPRRGEERRGQDRRGQDRRGEDRTDPPRRTTGGIG
jgi:hypothetical protein